jgi:hypothetical protein
MKLALRGAKKKVIDMLTQTLTGILVVAIRRPKSWNYM